MNPMTRFASLLRLIPWLVVGSFAWASFSVPPLEGPVMDLASMMAPADRDIVADKVRSLSQMGVAQIQVLTLPSLQGLPIEQASIMITDQWKLGDAKKDNGILILVAKEDRRVRIEVGQGLEGVLPDVVVKRITSDVMMPFFRQGLPSLGILKGVDAIILQINDGQLPRENAPERKSRSKKNLSPLVIFGLFLFVMLFRNFFGIRGHSSRGMGGFGGFGGGFGSSSGGGWSGGGGGFSGGGASDGW